jgi:hypothetical protein
VEHFPWEDVNNLTKVSPHMLQKVDVALHLKGEEHSFFGIVSSHEYGAYFGQIRSALPELDKKLTMSVMSPYVCSSSRRFAGLILMINSCSLFPMP